MFLLCFLKGAATKKADSLPQTKQKKIYFPNVDTFAVEMFVLQRRTKRGRSFDKGACDDCLQNVNNFETINSVYCRFATFPHFASR